MKRLFLLFCLLSTFSALTGLYELALGFSSVIPLIILAWHSHANKILFQSFLSISFLAGNLFCWVIGYLTCVYFLTPYGVNVGRHPVVVMVLVNLTIWGGLLGSLLGGMIIKTAGTKRSEAISFSGIPKPSFSAIILSFLIFVSFVAILFGNDYLYARGNFSRVQSLAEYFIVASSVLQYLLFFFIGFNLDSKLLSSKNIVYFLILICSVMIMSLPGGREASIRQIFFFMGGITFSSIPKRAKTTLFVALIALSVIIMVIIGGLRDLSSFGSGNADTKVDILLREGRSYFSIDNNSIDNAILPLFTRIAELSGPKVIDDVFENQKYIGLQGIERVATMFIPKLLYPDKPSLDDGPERLIAYGYRITAVHRVPITYLADSFQRGGFLFTFFASVLVCFYLALIGALLMKINSDLLRIILIINFSIIAFRSYTTTFFGLFWNFGYTYVRDGLMIFIVIFLLDAFSNKQKRKIISKTIAN